MVYRQVSLAGLRAPTRYDRVRLFSHCGVSKLGNASSRGGYFSVSIVYGAFSFSATAVLLL